MPEDIPQRISATVESEAVIIVDLPSPFRILSLCSGVGGLDLSLRLAIRDSVTVCFVEIEAFACEVLVSRMEDDILDKAPLWSNLKTFRGAEWRGAVDTIIGGFPCQPFSTAGRQRGVEDPRHLWPDIERIIGEVQPRWCFFENVPGLLTTRTPDNRYAYQIVSDGLHQLGYTIESGIFSAEEVGAPHKRKRLFILAHSDSDKWRPNNSKSNAATNGWNDIGGNGEVLVADASDISGEVSSPSKSDDKGRGTSSSAGGESIPNVANPLSIRHRGGNQGLERPEIQRRETTEDKIGEQSEVQTGDSSCDLEHTNIAGLEGYTPDRECSDKLPAWPPSPSSTNKWREVLRLNKTVEPAIRRVVDGVDTRLDSSLFAYRKERLRAVGNGVVPITGAYAFCILLNKMVRQ